MDSSKETCAMCLGTITPGQGQALFTAQCSHTFHFNCFASNVQHGNQICPTCCATWRNLPFWAPPPPPPPTTYPPPHFSFFPYTFSQPPIFPPPSNFADDEPLRSESGPSSSRAPRGQTGSITVKALPEYPALIRSQKGDPFAVLVGIRAPALSLEALGRPNTRAPLDLVAVLDVSASMSGDRIRLLKQAVNFIVDNLGPTDRLSIITFSTSAKRVTPFKRMTDEGRSYTTQAVNLICISGSTNIIAGLRMAVQVLDQRRQRNPVASIILLSDGQDNQNGKGPAFLRALSHLPVCIRSRDINSATQNLSPQTDAAIPVHTFGFGYNHDATALHAIADGSGGTFSYIESIEIIQDAFAECIGGLLSVVAQEVEINIQSGSPRVRIQLIPSGRYRNVVDRDEGRHGVVYVENLYAEEEKQFLVYLFVPEEEEALTTRLIEVKCSYKDPLSNENVVSETKIVEIRRLTSEALSETDREVCLEVDRERNRVSVTQGIAEAQAMADRGELEGARLILTQQSATLLSSASAQSGNTICHSLVHEMREIQGRMSSKRQYESGGRAYALSRKSAHMYQRATTQAVVQMQQQQQSASIPMAQLAACNSTFSAPLSAASPQAMGYQTPAMKKMITKSRNLRQSSANDDGEGKL